MKKIKINLAVKVLSCVAIPILILVIFAVMAIQQVGKTMEETMLERRLSVINHMFVQMFDLISDEQFHLEGEDIYYGSTNLTEDNTIIDRFHRENDVDVAIFYGTTRRATTVTDSAGKRSVGTQMPAEGYQKLKSDGYYFANNVIVEGEPYYAAYMLMANYGAGDEVTICCGLSAKSAAAIYKTRERSSVLFMLIIAVLSLFVSFLIARGIIKSIQTSIGHLDEVAEGKLNFAVSKKLTSRTDEVGNIARAIDSLVQKFIDIVHNLNDSSNTLTDFSENLKENFTAINGAINDINKAVEEVAISATTQATETQDVAEQMRDMGIAVEKSSENIGTLKNIAEEMEITNQEVSETLSSLVTISNNTRESIENVQRQTNDTNQSAMEIQNVVDFISDIAGQTNLLSLNASIEAARAGDQGRGFAVVADEVRQLAEQSRQSADQIEEIVQKLINNSNSSVEAMNVVMNDIQIQHDKLNQTQDAFDHLKSEISNVTTAVDGIAKEIDSIDSAKNKVYDNLENLAAISEENAASTQQTSATMTHLSELVNECDIAVGNLVGITDSLEGNVKKFTL
ncbi:MAG: cache domain-containing protein [Agathobacter sp.]|nr:cache domain-containing protein [Agathobacter sp.]